MIPDGLNNPFLAQKVDDVLNLPKGDVPELHQEAIIMFHSLLETVQRDNHSVGMIVIGEAGCGKSHLIAQLRQRALIDQKTVLAGVTLHSTYGSALWRHLRAQLATELLRFPPATDDRQTNGMLRILQNRFPDWAAHAKGGDGLLDWLFGKGKSGDLEPFLDDFAQNVPLNFNLQQVLQRLGNRELTTIAHAWLRGEPLTEKKLAKLGLAAHSMTERQQEIEAREVVLSVLRLAGDQTQLVICFDEIEHLQAGSEDSHSLRQFGVMATSLLAEIGPRMVLTCIRPTTYRELEHVTGKQHSYLQKMGQETITIPPLSWEQACRIISSRLEASPGFHEHRSVNQDNLFWPLSEEFVLELFENNRKDLTPRHLLRACASEFRQLRSGRVRNERAANMPPKETNPIPAKKGAVAVRPQIPNADQLAKELDRLWDRQRKKFFARTHSIEFDSMMSKVIPWLVNIVEFPLEKSAHIDWRLGDVNLLFMRKRVDSAPIGVSFCNEGPRTLWWRLDRLINQWEFAKRTKRDSVKGKKRPPTLFDLAEDAQEELLGKLVLLRSEAERVTKGSRERLDSLKRDGATVLLIAKEQMAELTAFQVLMTTAMSGELTWMGKPVGIGDYDNWAKSNLSAAVKEFLDSVFEHESETHSELGATRRNRKEKVK